MTLQEIIDQYTEAGISFDTQLTVIANDYYLLIKGSVYLDRTYFGNCKHGKWTIASVK